MGFQAAYGLLDIQAGAFAVRAAELKGSGGDSVVVVQMSDEAWEVDESPFAAGATESRGQRVNDVYGDG